MERVNFAAEYFNDVEKPGVRDIIERLAKQNGGSFSPEDVVNSCLDLMGPITMSEESTRSALIQHVAKKGDLSLRERESGKAEDDRVAELLGLIAATKEYHRA